MNKSTKFRFFSAVLAGCAVAQAAPGSAGGGGTMQELLKVLKEQGTISEEAEEAYDKLSDAAKEEGEKAQDKVSKVAKEEAEKTLKSQFPKF
ncbi:MAG: hypothetical protein ACREX4_07475, partial [Gammaproteobacteria bacterium]